MSSNAGTSKRILSRFSLAHGLMIVAGLLTFVTVSRALDDRNALTDVLVVNQSVVAGSTIGADAVAMVQIPAGSNQLSGLAQPTDVTGQVARRDLTPGEPLLASDLVPAGADDLPRTYTLAVDSHVIEGLGLAVGDQLDLIGLDAENRPHFVVASVPVARLSGDQTSGAFAVAGASTWVTVAVGEQAALQLAEAEGRGDITLVRSTGAPVAAVQPQPVEAALPGPAQLQAPPAPLPESTADPEADSEAAQETES